MIYSIDKAKAADAAEMIEYLKQVGGETDNLTFGAEGLPITVEEEAEYIARHENSKDEIMLVVKDKGKIIANANLNRLPRRMSHRGDLGISVLKEYWNKGIGGQLLSRIIDFARDNSFDIIELEVRSDNFAAIHLYEKYGFKKLFTHPAFFKIADELIDIDHMCLKLR